jgi:hypothetical protein
VPLEIYKAKIEPSDYKVQRKADENTRLIIVRKVGITILSRKKVPVIKLLI